VSGCYWSPHLFANRFKHRNIGNERVVWVTWLEIGKGSFLSYIQPDIFLFLPTKLPGCQFKLVGCSAHLQPCSHNNSQHPNQYSHMMLPEINYKRQWCWLFQYEQGFSVNTSRNNQHPNIKCCLWLAVCLVPIVNRVGLVVVVWVQHR